MKISVNYSELQEWDACEEGLEEFYAVHGNKTVSLSDALESNSVNDCLCTFFRNKDQFSEQQVKDVKLLLCDFADSVLHIFEARYPNDDRPREAIRVAREYINSDAAEEAFVVTYAASAAAAAVAAAEIAAVAAAEIAAAAAAAAEIAAAAAADAYAAVAAAESAAAESAAAAVAAAEGYTAARQRQKDQLIMLIRRWESS